MKVATFGPPKIVEDAKGKNCIIKPIILVGEDRKIGVASGFLAEE